MDMIGGDNLKLQELRKRSGLTQAELSTRSGVNLRTIQEYEYGRKKVDLAKISTITALAEALEVPMSEIIDDPKLAKQVKHNAKREDV
jgi:transcriptional regulator with XRE-family HTH domain